MKILYLVLVSAVAAASLALGTAAAPKAPAKPTKVAAKKFVKTKSGLKYAILRPGKGAVARPRQRVDVHYTGWLTNGKKFDSSLDRDEPFQFELGGGQVIPGWDEGVKGMKEGEKRQLVVPSALGYGEDGAGEDVPPNSTLIFEVELLRIYAG